MDKFELKKEFYNAGVPHVTWETIETFCGVCGDNVSKEEFVLKDFFYLFHNVFNETTIRKFEYLKKYLKKQIESKFVESENISENIMLSRRIKYFKQESEYLKRENNRLKKELAKRDKVVKKYGKLASCICEFQNAYADYLVEGENEK